MAIKYDKVLGALREKDASGAGTGDVAGPGASTDNAVARFDGVTGKILKNSNAILTNNGQLTITDSQAENNLIVIPTGNSGNSSSVGGAVRINNTSNVGAGMVIYSNCDSTSEGHLLVVRADNAGFDQNAIYISYDGTGNALNIANTGSTTGNGALNVGSTNPDESCVKITSVETARGAVKISHTGDGSDASASCVSIDMKGTGTACQGFYADSTAVGGTTGDLLRLRNETVDKFVVDYQGNVTVAGTITGAPGSTTELLFNNGGDFDAISNIVWDDTNKYLTYTANTDDNSLLIKPATTAGLVNSPYWAMRTYDTGNAKDMNFQCSRTSATEYSFEISDTNGNVKATFWYDGDVDFVGALSLGGDLSIGANDINMTGIIRGCNKVISASILSPGLAYAVDTQVPLPLNLNAMHVTRVKVQLNTTAQNVAGDLKYADDLTAFTNATLIRAFDTTSGALDATGLNVAVPAGKHLYLDFDSAPNAAITFMSLSVVYDDD